VSERGARILCDFLVVGGFLTNDGQEYRLTPDSAAFLDRRSPAYMGGITDFLLSPHITDGFKDVAASVRKGGTVLPEGGSVAPEHPMWVRFARAMAPMMHLPAQLLADLVEVPPGRPTKVLDLAAGHGLFGIAFARRHPDVEVVAQDWPAVLEVAQENARAAGVADRYRTLAGSAFDVEYGTGYDLVLLTNFLHHFDPPTCETLLRKVHAALADGGRAVTLEFVPNPDRVSPPAAAAFSLIMLSTTPAGDAYTFPELEAMFAGAGFLPQRAARAAAGHEPGRLVLEIAARRAAMIRSSRRGNPRGALPRRGPGRAGRRGRGRRGSGRFCRRA
jgi:SAM-dependent methyltransferase